MKLSRRDLILGVGLILITSLLFAWLVDWRAVTAQLRSARWEWVAAASALLLAGLGLYALNWRWLMAGRAPLGATFHAANVGHATNLLLPLRLGEAARVAALAGAGAAPGAVGTAAVVVERLLLQVMRLGALGAALAAGLGLRLDPVSVGGGLIFLAAAFAGLLALRRARGAILARGPRWLARLPRLTEARSRMMLVNLLDGLEAAATPGRLAVALSLTALSWLCFLGFHALVLLALPDVPATAEGAALALGVLALAPPAAPAQPGVYHASVVAPLALLGFAETRLTAYAVLLHAVMMMWMLALGGLGLVALRRQRK